jgi:hypothetical protein
VIGPVTGAGVLATNGTVKVSVVVAPEITVVVVSVLIRMLAVGNLELKLNKVCVCVVAVVIRPPGQTVTYVVATTVV